MDKRHLTLACVLIVTLCPLVLCQDARAVHQIEVDSHWMGLEAKKGRFTIRNVNGSFRHGLVKVQTKAIDALVAALKEPPIEKPDLANLGITQAWLDARVEANIPYFFTPAERARFRSSFTDLATVQDLLPFVFQYSKSDDFPSVQVTVTFSDGSRLTAKSHSHYLQMLPWTVDSNGQTYVTYNAKISNALAAVMPKKTTNRERLLESSVEQVIADGIYRQVADQTRREKKALEGKSKE
jgi:hypothetical protein